MDFKAALENIRQIADTALTVSPTPSKLVKAGENLQAVLDSTTGTIELEAGATFEGVTVRSNRTILGPNSFIKAKAGIPAINIPLGSTDVQVVLGGAQTEWDQRVIRVGDGENTDASLTPKNIKLSIKVPTHRGKSAFYICGENVDMDSCSAYDVYDPALRDSQAIVILNTPGNILIHGPSHFEAGSEVFLIGGAAMAIPLNAVSNVVIDGGPNKEIFFGRPLSWKTDGVNRKVKNILEFKNGINCTAKNIVMDGCWRNAQDGWAVIITPRLGAQVQNILIEDVTVRNCSGFVRAIGYDDTDPGPQFTGLTLNRIDAITDWRFVSCDGPLDQLVVDSCSWDGPNMPIYNNPGVTWTNGVRGESGISHGVRIVNNHFAYGQYGIMVNGFAHGKNWQQAWPDGVISGNTFVGATNWTAPNNLPGNTFVDNKF